VSTMSRRRSCRPAVPREHRYRVPDARYKSGYRVTRWGRRALRKWEFLLSAWGILSVYLVSIHLAVLAALSGTVLAAYGGYRVKRHFFPRRTAAWSRLLDLRTQARNEYPELQAAPAGETRQRQQIPREVRAAVWLRDGGRCRHCGITDAEATARTGVHLHYDHIVPFSRNGADTENNIQLLCEECNLGKSNRYTG